MKRGRRPECNCPGCVSKRRAQQRWVEKNRDRTYATNARSRAKRKTIKPDLSPEVSDEELDRRALEMDRQLTITPPKS